MRLPNELILDILPYLSTNDLLNVSLVDRLFYLLVEEFCRSYLVETFSVSHKSACSWTQMYALVKSRLYHFFSVSSIRMVDPSLYDESAAPFFVGTWRSIPGYPWGPALHAANVAMLELQFELPVEKGSYLVYLALKDIREQSQSLHFISFNATGDDISTHWASFPPWELDKQVPPNPPLEICVGCLDAGKRTKVTFTLENASIMMSRNITFLYVCIEPVSPHDSFYKSVKPHGWQFPTTSASLPTRLQCEVYKSLFN